MKFMLLIYSAEENWTEEERAACMEASSKICDELDAAGKFLGAAPLHPVSTATSLRVRHGQSQVTDGPFAETNEQLGGYYLLELASREEAIEIASRLPPAKKGTVEIRPIVDLPELSEISKQASISR